jgi:hypothetical protein
MSRPPLGPTNFQFNETQKLFSRHQSGQVVRLTTIYLLRDDVKNEWCYRPVPFMPSGSTWELGSTCLWQVLTCLQNGWRQELYSFDTHKVLSTIHTSRTVRHFRQYSQFVSRVASSKAKQSRCSTTVRFRRNFVIINSLEAGALLKHYF